MILPVRRHGFVWAFLLGMAWSAPAAENLTGAARELARKTSQFLGHEPAAFSFRNSSSLGGEDLTQLRGAFEATLKDLGARLGEAGPVEIRVTLSESATEYLAVEEARRGEDRQVWLASWPKGGEGVKATGLRLEKQELWRQDEPILDAAFVPAGMLVLSAVKLSLLVHKDDRWTVSQTASIAAPKPWPRDLRGRLRTNGTGFQAFLPGVNCNGTTEPEFSLECKPGDQPWLLESGSRLLLLANFAAGRNYFDGHIVTQAGARKTTPPFYTAAAVEEEGRTIWLLTLLDGRAQITDASFEPVDYVTAWGSDIAGIDSRCGAATAVLATKPGDGDSETIQAYRVSGRSAAPLGAAVPFPGPVTALWTAGGASAVATTREPGGAYAAYLITVNCGQ